MSAIYSKTTENFTLSATLSEDKSKLFISVERLTGKVVTKEELIPLLKEFVDLSLVDMGVLDDLIKSLKSDHKVEGRRIARGKQPTKGVDGKILYLVKKFSARPEVAVNEKGMANYTELHLFDNVKIDQKIARVYPPKPGVDGTDALGKPIKSEIGKPIALSLDKSIVQQPSENKEDEFQILVAKEDGFVMEKGSEVKIQTELQITGDIDYHWGNVDFVGAVKISGDVQQGFTVRGTKGVTIGGGIRDARIEASDGSVVINGLAFGGDFGRVVAAKDCSVSIAHKIRIEAKGQITIKKEAIDCDLRAGSMLSVNTGQLSGGEAYAVCGVEGKILGNAAEMKTKLRLCSDVETSTEYTSLLINIANHDKAIGVIELHLGPLAKNPSRVQFLKEPHRSKMALLVKKLAEVNSSKEVLLIKKTEMLSSSHGNLIMRVNIEKIAHRGVEIFAGEDVFLLKDPVDGPKSIDYSPEKHTFDIGPMKPLECSPSKVEQKGDKDEPGKEPTK